jgi:NAD-dependent dihydropyrimidine dehydrogenase PreA subunit
MPHDVISTCPVCANELAVALGCLGYGDCVAACKFDALHIVDGLATVDYNKCTGCTACSKACPRNLIQMVPFSSENMMVVACRNRETGKVTRSVCKVGCIACGICAKQSDLFTEENLLVLIRRRYKPMDKETVINMPDVSSSIAANSSRNHPPQKPADASK